MGRVKSTSDASIINPEFGQNRLLLDTANCLTLIETNHALVLDRLHAKSQPDTAPGAPRQDTCSRGPRVVASALERGGPIAGPRPPRCACRSVCAMPAPRPRSTALFMSCITHCNVSWTPSTPPIVGPPAKTSLTDVLSGVFQPALQLKDGIRGTRRAPRRKVIGGGAIWAG